MASQYFAILTDYGTRAIAHALSQGQPLQLTQFAVGDGNGKAVTPTASATALVHQTHIAPVSAVSLDPRNNKQVIVELTIPENVGGFYIREMGVFDSQNKLIAYANCPESFKPTESSGSGKVQVLRMILKVESSSAVTLSIDHSVIFITRQQMTPKTITATSTNGVDERGHSHEIAKASLTQQGIVQLDSSTNSNAEDKAATPKAVKTVKDQVDSVQRNQANYIHNSKKSSAVDSNSEDTVANSAAVKTAYDKGVDAKTAADNAQRTANDGVSKANAAQTSANQAKSAADAAQHTANDGVSKATAAQTSANQAKSAADTAQRTANDGVSKANAAQTSANQAKSAADAAQHTANDGVSKANAAQTSANQAKSAADTAQQTASNANNNANTRQLKSELIGEVAFFARTTPPNGWLKANGAAVSRTTYAALFSAIGTTFGAGDGRTTFNLPDLRGEFLRCLDDGRNVDAGRRLGTTQGDAIRNITGVFDTSKGSWAQQFVDFAETSGAFDLIKGNKQWTGDPNNGGNNLPTGFKFDASRVVPTANENRPRNIALLACIKY